MKDVVINTTAYTYEFAGITFKPKSARPVTEEQMKGLNSVRLFNELVAQKKFVLSDEIPSEYKTETQRLNEVLAENASLKEGVSEEVAKAVAEVKASVQASFDALSKENAELKKELDELKKKGGK